MHIQFSTLSVSTHNTTQHMELNVSSMGEAHECTREEEISKILISPTKHQQTPLTRLFQTLPFPPIPSSFLSLHSSNIHSQHIIISHYTFLFYL